MSNLQEKNVTSHLSGPFGVYAKMRPFKKDSRKYDIVKKKVGFLLCAKQGCFLLLKGNSYSSCSRAFFGDISEISLHFDQLHWQLRYSISQTSIAFTKKKVIYFIRF